MKNLGWQLFFALLLADIVALAMLKLSVTPKITTIIALLVFVILAAVLFFGSQAHERAKKREAEANAKIAELQDQITETSR